MRIWPTTPLGRRIVLQNTVNPAPLLPVRIGQSGTTTSELRPMGLCDFDGQRIEVKSEIGIIESGRRITVVNIDQRLPIVRKADQ